MSCASVSGVILAGGKSSRMGQDKALMEYRGERLIDRLEGILREFFHEIIIVTNTPADYLEHDAIIVTDIFPNKGPIGGIYTGLFYMKNDYAFVTACDMPFLNVRFINYIINLIEGHDIVVPQTLKGFEPLNAVYSKRCIPALCVLNET